MKYFILSISILLVLATSAQEPYLKIQAYGDNYFAYPPHTEFDVMNEAGELVFTEKDLNEFEELELKGDYTVKIYTSWGNGEDEFKVDNAMLTLEEPDEKQYDWSKYDRDEWFGEQPDILKKSFTENKDGTYDAEIVFQGDIRFEYRNGQGSISENGQSLELKGNYIAHTSAGTLKLSYNPSKKKYYYVFVNNN